MFVMLNFIYVIGFTTIITSFVSSVCIFSAGAQIILSKSQHPIVSVAYLLPLTYMSILFGFLYTMLAPLVFMFGVLADVIQYSTFFNKNRYDYLVNKQNEVVATDEATEGEEVETECEEAEKKETYENETSDEEISKSQFDEETSDEETDKTKIDKKEFINYVINKCNTDLKYTTDSCAKDTTDSYVKDDTSSCKVGEKCESCDCSN
jgi:hypothetical protein